MNEPNNTSTYQEFVLRRLSEPLTIRGHDYPSWLWWGILGAVLLAGFVYIVWMYVKDSRGVGPWWAIFLGTLRTCVYVLLAGVFLLPAQQTWEETSVMGKVLVLVDTSASMTKVLDDVPTGKSQENLLTRQDKVLQFLTDKKINFFGQLAKKNPVTLYRFAQRPDEDFLYFTKDGKDWTRAEWDKKSNSLRASSRPNKQIDPDFVRKNLLWKMLLFALIPVGLLYLGMTYPRASRRSRSPIPLLFGAVNLVLFLMLAGVLVLFATHEVRPDESLQPVSALTAERSAEPSSDFLPREYLTAWLKPGSKVEPPPEAANVEVAAAAEPARLTMKRVEDSRAWLWRIPLLFVLPGGLIVVGMTYLLVNRRGTPIRAALVAAPILLIYGCVAGFDIYMSYGIDWMREVPDTDAAVSAEEDHKLTPEERAKKQSERFEKLAELNKKLQETGYFSATNVGQSVLSTVNRELNGRVQGIVIITDGRSTEGSPKTYYDIETRAKSARIPLFVVGVGQERPQVKIDIVDVRVPEQVQPEDKFRAVVEVQGEGLPDKPVKVFLDITYTMKDKKGKDVDLEMKLTEQVNTSSPEEKRATLSLNTKKLTLEAPAPVTFDRSSPPRATVEFPIDAAALAKAAHIDLESGDTAGKKWELSETGDGELRFRVRVPREAQEAFAAPFHITEPAVLRVVKRPLRVLLFASSATRDYQFLRSILVRETDKKRAELSIYLQLPPGVTERHGGIVQDVPPERLLGQFPTRLEAADKDDQLYALDQYDVIVAFDPDWTQLSESQLKMVGRWVENGGGLIAIGGPINTLELARPKSHAAKLKPILDLYPVVLSDVRISDFDRDTKDPWPLNFTGGTPDMEYLKLDESEDAKFMADWDAFFYGADGKKGGTLLRGFYNYYPVEKAKTSAVVVARFTDPKGRLKDNSLQPYLVTTSPSSNRRVVWIGSGEMWRLRSYNVSYHERFWMKLLRYAASNTMSRVSKRIRLYMGSTHVANKPIEIEGKFEGKDGEPLPPGPKLPTVKLTPPPGMADSVAPKPFEMKAKPNGEGWFSGRFQVRAAGDYTLTVKNPETGDSLTSRFSVKESNPEMDNTRPDFQTMYQLASEADDVLGRMGDAERQELKRRLQRPKMEGEAFGDNKNDKIRLYFDLQNAPLIPACMRPDVQTLRNRGPIQDLWDDGFVIWNAEPQPITMSYVLAAVVGLLSLEWLTRKLLRLA